MLRNTRRRRTRAPVSNPGTLSAAYAGESGAENFVIRFDGNWDVPTVIAREKEIAALRPTPGNATVIDLSGVERLDTVGAIAIVRLRDKMAEAGRAEIIGIHDVFAGLLQQIEHVDAQPIPPQPVRTLTDHVATLGKYTVKLWLEGRDLLGFFGELCVVYARVVTHPKQFRLTSVVNQMQVVGIGAMPIVGLLAFLVGIVLTFISGDQLQRLGAGIFIVNLVGVGTLRELGILITAIIVAGRSGSAFTAEIGTMKINQEVDAMRTIGLDPMAILVVPRTLALMVMLVPLGFFADLVMIGGGAVMSSVTLGISFRQFVIQFQSSISLTQLWVGMVKAPVFAFLIAMVGCFHGLKVEGSAESVGHETTQSVVQSIFLVIAFDAIFEVFFNQIGW